MILHLVIGFEDCEISKPYLRNIFPENLIGYKMTDYSHLLNNTEHIQMYYKGDSYFNALINDINVNSYLIYLYNQFQTDKWISIDSFYNNLIQISKSKLEFTQHQQIQRTNDKNTN